MPKTATWDYVKGLAGKAAKPWTFAFAVTRAAGAQSTNVDVLLGQYKGAIAQLRKMLGGAFPPAGMQDMAYDDLYLLRYLLSNKDKARFATCHMHR